MSELKTVKMKEWAYGVAGPRSYECFPGEVHELPESLANLFLECKFCYLPGLPFRLNKHLQTRLEKRKVRREAEVAEKTRKEVELGKAAMQPMLEHVEDLMKSPPRRLELPVQEKRSGYEVHRRYWKGLELPDGITIQERLHPFTLEREVYVVCELLRDGIVIDVPKAYLTMNYRTHSYEVDAFIEHKVEGAIYLLMERRSQFYKGNEVVPFFAQVEYSSECERLWR